MRPFIPHTRLILSSLYLCLFILLAPADLQAQKKGILSKFTKKSSNKATSAASDSTTEEADDVLAAGEYDTLKLNSDAIPDLMLDADKRKAKEKEVKKKKKIKKNVYYGLKTRKNFTKTGNGDRQVIELFYTLREYKDPNPYVRHVFWYDSKSRKITDAAIKDKETALILHGPYQKIAGGKVIEEGFYYVGAKHGRWEKYKGESLLMDKVKYLRGFPKEADISYFDVEKTKIKEVIPKEYGVVKGEYYRYYAGGQLECEGHYDNGVKVGRWLEYYEFRRQRRQETIFGKDAFDTDFAPYVVREWDETGAVLFDKDKGIDNRGKLPKVVGNTAKKGAKTPKTTSTEKKEAEVPVSPTEQPKDLNTPPAAGKEENTTIINQVPEKEVVAPTDSTTTPGPKKFDNTNRPGARKRRPGG
jgi:antitoxin component YwqK of YwqJK toxin-antitoxin module